MGAGAAWALAERGHDVVLLDQAAIPNPLSASSAETRSFRLSHGDRADVRLALRALELWHELARRSGRTVYGRTGILHTGSVVEPMAAAFAAEGVPHFHLDADQVARIFPELRRRPDVPAMFQPDGGVNFADEAILGQVELAARAGAEIAPKERVIALAPRESDVTVFTERRRIVADVCIVSAGPWAGGLLDPIDVHVPFEAGVSQVTYFRSSLDWENRPSLMERTRSSEDGIYGLISPSRGFKLGYAAIDQDLFHVDWRARPLNRALEARLVQRMREDLPGFDPTPLHTEACPITLTPDHMFVLDRRGPIVIGSGCSGHAFKFSPLLGALLADLAEGRRLPADAERFRLDRPTLAQAAGAARGMRVVEA
jgi:sarcosine oxidase